MSTQPASGTVFALNQHNALRSAAWFCQFSGAWPVALALRRCISVNMGESEMMFTSADSVSPWADVAGAIANERPYGADGAHSAGTAGNDREKLRRY